MNTRILVKNYKKMQITRKIQDLVSKFERGLITIVEYNESIERWTKFVFYGNTNYSRRKYNQLLLELNLGLRVYSIHFKFHLYLRNIEIYDTLGVIANETIHISRKFPDMYEVNMNMNADNVVIPISIIDQKQFTLYSNNLRTTRELHIEIQLFYQLTELDELIEVGKFRTVDFVMYSRQSKAHTIIDDRDIDMLLV